tara:strand:- start:609 stop:866 length:258 start_codon:yes stop_codon:yes gene_type:complete
MISAGAVMLAVVMSRYTGASWRKKNKLKAIRLRFVRLRDLFRHAHICATISRGILAVNLIFKKTLLNKLKVVYYKSHKRGGLSAP